MSFFLLMGVPSSREKMRPYGLDRPFTAFSYRRMTSASGGTMGTILPVRDLGLVSAQGPQRGLMSYPSGVSHCASGHRDCFFLLHGYIPFLGPQHPWTSVTVCSFQSNVYVPRRKSRLSRVAPNISPCRFPVSIRHYKMAPSSTGFWNTTSSMARSLGTLKALRPPLILPAQCFDGLDRIGGDESVRPCGLLDLVRPDAYLPFQADPALLVLWTCLCDWACASSRMVRTILDSLVPEDRERCRSTTVRYISMVFRSASCVLCSSHWRA